MELSLEKKHEIETKAKQMIECLKAILLLSGIEAKRIHQLPNGYCGDLCCPHRPWMLAETKYGPIKIGWRKRVISIEWTNDVVTVHGKETLAKGDEIVTNWDTGVHAWGNAKAIEQLSRFVELAERILYNKEADTRFTAPELDEFRQLLNEQSKSIENKTPDSFSQSKYERLQQLHQKRSPKQG